MALPIIVATGQGNVASAGVECRGHLGFSVYGTHGAGTSTLQSSPDDGVTWINLAAGVLVDSLLVVEVPIGSLVRLSTAGGAANSVSCRGGQVQQVG